TKPAAIGATPGDSSREVSVFGWTVSLSSTSVGPALLIAFIAGIIFNVMPCVLPVLPLKIMGFYEASQHQRGRTLLFGITFSLGILTIFALLAIFVLFSKAIIGRSFSWGEQFSHGWFVWGAAILLALLGFGTMG